MDQVQIDGQCLLYYLFHTEVCLSMVILDKLYLSHVIATY